MREQDLLVAVGVIAAFAVVLVAVVLLVSRRAALVREILRSVAAAAGWSEVRPLRVRTGFRGVWRSFPVSIAYGHRQKGAPERFTVGFDARTDIRLEVKRRFEGAFANRPLTWFGPPLVEVHQPAARTFWVRSNEPSFADRLFAEEAVATAIDAVLVARYDEVRVNGRGLRVLRSLDTRAVRRKYGRPAFTARLDPQVLTRMAEETWTAAAEVAEQLAAT